ncbi:MAG: hypothetical protein JWM80_3300 [Cyanobacteria bacterium RYN_339]|nr:hypothetical protein [Cyanobacteria bacterium RYN_339]
MFRVRKDEGAVRGSNGYGIVALNDTEGIKDFDAMVKPYALGAILSPLGVESTPEAELSKKEVDAEAKIGGDIPNDGSWAEIFLSGPRVSEVKALYAGLRQKAYVRSIQVVGTPTN